MDPNVIRQIIDDVFALAEKKESGHPVVVAVLKLANGIVDSVLPQLLQQYAAAPPKA